MKLKLSPPPFPNRKEFPFTATIRYKGLIIDIENLNGSVREGTGPGGKKWRTKFDHGAHYGEIRGSKGADGDKLDIYIKDNPVESNKVYIIHQNFPRNHPSKAGSWDEDKVILGVGSPQEAIDLYLKHYDRKDFFRSLTVMPMATFKKVIFDEVKGEKVAQLHILNKLRQ
ncbi:MAG: hypothetical protein DRJ03_01845 [Chloroflexi bacterium]|nr:MAG: hypothetical protein DRJ03_01845 [Chloroflexota bacterium]